MLGKTAGGLLWMFRYLERSENMARLVEAGFRIALTRPDAAEDEWKSVIDTAGVRDAFSKHHTQFDAASVLDFLLRDTRNASSVMAAVETARSNARLVRTALSREVWEATNECWMTLKGLLSQPILERELPTILSTIRQQSALVRGALYSTLYRNDIFDFARIGTYLERADSTARILDVKYYVLLPSVFQVGSTLDNVQWETILRSVSGQRAHRWLHGADISAKSIADLLVLDRRMPRSLAFCYAQIADSLGYLADDYGVRHSCHDMADNLYGQLRDRSIDTIFDMGLHEFIEGFLRSNAALGSQIENDYRFFG